MRLTIETYWQNEWRASATMRLDEGARGYLGASEIEYDIDYFANFAAADRHSGGDVIDARAFSVRCPVDLENRRLPTWPPFLLDLMPQGHARRRMAEVLKIDANARESDLELLLRGAGNPIGNVRIREAAVSERARLSKVVRAGVTEDDIYGRTERFVEVADRFGMIASGSSALQGEWPKIAMTQAHDGLYYPDAFVSDEEAVRHVIVKLLRSRDERDRMILEAEAGYSRLAQEMGLHVHETARYENGVLVIPRFDREVRDGRVVRYGQESMVSAIGVADFAHLASHEEYIEVLQMYSEDVYADVVEYVRRDLANRAFGNPDNHGRNTALTKGPSGGVRLSPLFDFAPMRLASEGVVKSTRWASMRDSHRDTRPDWIEVCQAIFPDDEGKVRSLVEDLATFAERMRVVADRASEFGLPDGVVEVAMRDCETVVADVLGAGERVSSFKM